MKAEELMVGDWVQLTQSPNKISKIENDRGFYTVWCGGVGTPEDFVEPIPLTPEILEKSGFVNTLPWWMFEDFGVIFNEDGIRASVTGHLSLHIKYVHELQHALRLFGIDKEIEL